MSDVSETLRAARKLIEKPENWCQWQYAMNADGDRVFVMADDATRWCLSGAMQRVCGSFNGRGRPAYQALLDVVDTGSSGRAIPHFNDTHTHPEVLAVLDRAIAEAEKAHG